MIGEPNYQNILVYFFTVVYALSFRASTQRAALWGAFEFYRGGLILSKIMPYSAPILILIPVFSYLPLLWLATNLPYTKDLWLSKEINLAVSLSICLFLGLFPYSTKHLWGLIADSKFQKGSDEGKPGDGWVNKERQLAGMPDNRLYSFQVIILLGIIPIFAMIIPIYVFNIQIRFPGNLWHHWFTLLYVGQLLVMFEIGKFRGYFHHHPKRLLSFRMLLNLFTTILVPSFVGIILYLNIPKMSFDFSITGFYTFLFLVIILPFPFFCTQTMLLCVRPFNWKGEYEKSQLVEHSLTEIEDAGAGNFWKFCFVMAFIEVLLIIITFRIII